MKSAKASLYTVVLYLYQLFR